MALVYDAEVFFKGVEFGQVGELSESYPLTVEGAVGWQGCPVDVWVWTGNCYEPTEDKQGS